MSFERAKRKMIYLGRKTTSEDTHKILDILEEIITEIEVMEEDMNLVLDALAYLEENKEGGK